MLKSLLVTCTMCVAVASLSACAHKMRPDDMSAAEHRAKAAEHEEEARLAEDREYEDEAITAISAPPDPFYAGEIYRPPGTDRAEALRHKDHARDHLAAAKTLETFEEKECAALPGETRPVCPLMGTIADVQDIDGGVSLQFTSDANKPAIIAHIKCHFAFGQTRGFEGMDNCPLYVKGLTVVEREGRLELTAPDEASVVRLRAQTREHLDAHGATPGAEQ